jgi:leader peptidase (prepilin peptidase) / N-methyltransferase
VGLAIISALVGAGVGAVVCSFIAQEVRAPRLLDPFEGSELPAVCRTCHTRLRPDRIGLYINRDVLRGRCPSCKHPVPSWGAWAEIATVLMGFLVGWRVQKPLWLPPYLLLGFIIVAVVLVDARLHLISTKLVYPAAAAALVLFSVIALIEKEPDRFQWMLIGGLLASAFIWMLHIGYRGGMGQGDARLSLFLGMFLGWLGWRHLMIGMFAGFLFGSVGGIVLLALRKAGMKTQLAFGPYLAMGALLISLWPSLAEGFVPR